MRQLFEDQDAPELAGWIIDVRGIGGGNMYGMIGGLVTVLGEGEFGAFVSSDQTVNWWGYRQGQVTYAGYPQFYASAHELIRPNPKVAVLTDCSVASSGEAVVISFRGRPNTRSFGTPTYGADKGGGPLLGDPERVLSPTPRRVQPCRRSRSQGPSSTSPLITSLEGARSAEGGRAGPTLQR